MTQTNIFFHKLFSVSLRKLSCKFFYSTKLSIINFVLNFLAIYLFIYTVKTITQNPPTHPPPLFLPPFYEVFVLTILMAKNMRPQSIITLQGGNIYLFRFKSLKLSRVLVSIVSSFNIWHYLWILNTFSLKICINEGWFPHNLLIPSNKNINIR